jgi:hypothetical protein
MRDDVTGPAASAPPTSWPSRLLRVGLWTMLTAGIGAALTGLAGLIVIPFVTMSPLPAKAALSRLTGSIVEVRDNTPAVRAAPMQIAKSRLLIRSTDRKETWVTLDRGYFVARDLERRCGFGDHNLDSVINRPADVLVDAQARVMELRIGRVLCVTMASAEREAHFSDEVRRRGYLYGPLLIAGGLTMAATAAHALGLFRRRRESITADRD